MILSSLYGKIRILLRDILRTWISFRSKRYLRSLKDQFNGKRCFIVGNGPSLKVEDLEKLKHEYTFGSHRIYKIFPQTTWRPTFYCAQDFDLIVKDQMEIRKVAQKNCFICFTKKVKENIIKQATILRIDTKTFYPDLPEFSRDVTECIYEGFTVTYAILQIAIYMGFSEIYLLGVDHSYSMDLDKNGQIIYKQQDDHFTEDDKITNIPQTCKSTLAYVKAKQIADSLGVNIFNATRGGALEVFPRVSFDNLNFYKQ